MIWRFTCGELNISDWRIQTTNATVEFVFGPEERDVYSYEHPPRDLAPLGAKPGTGTIADAGKGGCAPTERRSKERTAKL